MLDRLFASPLRLAHSLIPLLAVSAPAQRNQEEFFGLDKIWDVHFEVARADWIAMFPPPGRTSTRLFGKYPYRPAAVTIGDHALGNVGLRMKGNATFIATGGTLKRSLKIDFDRFERGRRFLGMGKLNLQCNALDRTQIKEAVSYSVYRACGLPAGRTAFARVFLTMPGELDRAYIGLYTVVEQVDQRFMKRVLGGGGLILKPDGETLGYYGASWNEDYDAAYHPKAEVTDGLVQPVVATAALFDEPRDSVLADGIEAVMDVDSFLAYTAATAILINTDSPLTVPDNYYLVVPRSTKKVTWVPWDMNWSMGEYGRVTSTPHLDLDVLQPTQKEVFHRMLAIPRFQVRYRAIVARYIAGPCSADAVIAAIERADATVHAARVLEDEREPKVTDAGEELGGRRREHPMLRVREGDTVAGLIEFAKERTRLVTEQLSGASEGRSAHNLFGANERMPRGDGIRDVFASTAGLGSKPAAFAHTTIAEAIPAAFAALDTDQSGAIAASEMAEVLRTRWRASGARWPGDQSEPRSRRSMRYVDGNGDGAVSSEEWRAGVLELFRFWDRDCDGRWSSRELNLPRQ